MKKTDKIEVLENGILQVREQEILELKDGTTRVGEYYRYVLTPDTDLNSINDDKVKAIAAAVWTQDVIDSYKGSIATTI